MHETIHIEALAYGGDGVGHLADGRTAFVPRTCPGDTVEAEITESKERFARARVVELAQAAPTRTQPLCPEAASGRCGGCPWAHIDYAEQLRWKRQALVDALTHIAKLDAAQVETLIPACIPSKKQWNYRNKVEFDARRDAAGHFTLGMHASGGDFAPLSACQLFSKKLVKAPKALTGALRYLQGNEDLGIERVGLRNSVRTGSTEVALWTRTGPFPRAKAAQLLKSALPVKNTSVIRVLLKGTAAERKVSGVELLAGHGAWAEQIGEYRMLLSAPSFFQVNTAGAEALVKLVMEALQPGGLDTVVDLYAGAGTFTLPLAEAALNVMAVESYGPAVRDLRRNLEENQLFAEVIGGDAARELPGMGAIDLLVVDPPRSGLGNKAVEGLLACGARRVAYVSCNPTTLARDLKVILAGGYTLDAATPVDLFPQSYHVETVAVLSKHS